MKLLREYIRSLLIETAIGQCYPHVVKMAKGSSQEEFADLTRFKVAHGRVTDKYSGESVLHAWVEKGDMVFDWQTHATKPDGIPKDVYYDMYTPEIHNEYTAEETMINCLKSGQAGPWTLKEEARQLFEANTYGWKVSSHKSMMLDKEGMPQQDKDNQEAYLKLMGLMESAQVNDLMARTILIPPPPPLNERLKELPRIAAQYKNNVNAPEMQDVLDTDSSPLYNAVIVAEGHPDIKGKIKNMLDSVKPAILAHKKHFSALRPNQLAETMGLSFEFDYLDSAQTSSYPSGHATQAYYVAHVLSDMYPSLSEEFFIIAEMVSQSRIDRGVHFPSDIEAGKQLAAAIHGIVSQR